MNLPDASSSAVVWLITAQYLAYALSWLLCAVVLREQRSAMLHWAAFMFLLGLGFLLRALVGEDVNSWVRVGANVTFATASVSLWRGGTSFLGLQDRGREQVLMLAAAIAGMVMVGASRERGPWQALWTYAALVWITLRSMTTTMPLALSRFGRRAVSWILVPFTLLFATYVWRFGIQLSDLSVDFNKRVDPRSVPDMLTFLAMAAAFNLTFMTMSLGILMGSLRKLANNDVLTGLANRRWMEQVLEREWQMWQRNRTPFSVMILDLDHFKRVNDNHGHAAGDRLLEKTARLLQGNARQIDMVARWGGEEFIVLMPDTAKEDAVIAAQRQRGALCATPVDAGVVSLSVTASIGVAEVRADDEGKRSINRVLAPRGGC